MTRDRVESLVVAQKGAVEVSSLLWDLYAPFKSRPGCQPLAHQRYAEVLVSLSLVYGAVILTSVNAMCSYPIGSFLRPWAPLPTPNLNAKEP